MCQSDRAVRQRTKNRDSESFDLLALLSSKAMIKQVLIKLAAIKHYPVITPKYAQWLVSHNRLTGFAESTVR